MHNDLQVAFSFKVNCDDLQLDLFTNNMLCNFKDQGPVVRNLVSANRWLRGIKTYRFPWYLTLVSANHASSNPGQMIFGIIKLCT